jgi:phosphonate transport system substrate-binding protein
VASWGFATSGGIAAVRSASALEKPLVMAFTPSRDPTALQESADAFVATVARLSGVPLRAQVASDYAGVIEALRSRRVDLAFVHPVGYVLARREAGCEILVRDVWENRTAYKASFYVREASGIKRLEELRGRTVAFVDPASSSGYIYPMVLLMKRGLVRDRDPKTFFKDALFAGTHEAALRAVLQGRVDVATTFDFAPQVHLKDPTLAAQLVSIAETPEIPEAGICARPGLPPVAIQALKRALLGMKKPEHATALKGVYDIDGFVEARDADYDPVREALTLMDYRPRR